MSQDAALLQQILSEKIGTDGLIQMGETQPYDLIRLYENPANATKLTNIGTDGLTTASTTVLVIDEGSARTGLTFEPDLSLLKHTGSDVKLLVSASVEQAVNVVLNHAGHTTTQLVTAPADKTAVLTIGLLAGIATVVGSHNFFDQAAAGNGAGGGLNPTLINGTFTNGVLHWTGGTITTPLGDINGVAMTVPASTSITLSDTSCAVAGQQNLFVIWSTLADAVAALAAMLQNQQGLYITYAQNDKHVAVDGITRYAFAATIEQTFTASGQHIHYDYGVGQGNTPDTTQPAPTYMHVIVVDPTGGTVPDATLGLA